MRPASRFPVWDNHFHLDPAGRGKEAVKDFERAGGTHLLLVHKPYHDLPPGDLDRTREALERTVRMAGWVREAGVVPFLALAPHPAEFTEMLRSGLSLDEAAATYEASLRLAAAVAQDAGAVALGEIGRPHYPVEPAVWERANALMDLGLALCRDHGLAAILHTESATPEVFADLAVHVRKAGLPFDKAVKHYSAPLVDPALNHGLLPSVIVGKDQAERAIAQGTRFLMETDYMDDPRRPGGVLGPKTVPRRTFELLEKGLANESQMRVVHAENPRKAYGVDVAV